jgi:hypothetical protein
VRFTSSSWLWHVWVVPGTMGYGVIVMYYHLGCIIKQIYGQKQSIACPWHCLRLCKPYPVSVPSFKIHFLVLHISMYQGLCISWSYDGIQVQILLIMFRF